MFSTTCQYAIRAILYLALNTDDNHKIGADVLSEELEMPKHFLAKILQQLTKSGFVSSSKGRNGGFYLSDKDKASNLLEIIYVIDGPSRFENCILGLKECSGKTPCPYHSDVQTFRRDFKSKLQNETIFESAKRIAENNLTLNINH